MEINPWSNETYDDYQKLLDEFGIAPFRSHNLPDPPKLIRRGVVFGERGFEIIEKAIIEGKEFAILTGLVPSGKMHIGHKMVIDLVLYYQSLGAKVTLAVADIEGYGARAISFEEGRDVAIEEYILNYIALGLKEKDCEIYFQSRRKEVLDLAFILGAKTNLSEMKAIYGFKGESNMCHIFAPLVQVGDILHPQLEKFHGPIPTLVPVGVDQDPHIRLTRKLSQAHRLVNVKETKDGKIGVFGKSDDNIAQLLDRCQNALSKKNFSMFKKIIRYKALYVNDASTWDLAKIDEVVIPIEKEMGGYGFYPPASTYHRFMTGLTGGKMSSSAPESSIFLSDIPEEGYRKVIRAKTGGRQSLGEQREKGGEPDRCCIYELFLYHLLDDDDELLSIRERCLNGKLMCGECKKMAGEMMKDFLRDLAEKRENFRERLGNYLADD